MRKIDLTGRVFGSLQVLCEAPVYISPKGYRQRMWHCKCACGNFCDVSGSHLVSGHSSSCGCKQRANLTPRKARDLTGQRFGMLTVLYRMPNRQVGKRSRVVWHCRCDCGKETDVLALLLFEGLVKSCGCLSVSHAERLMEDYLNAHDICFQPQYYFKDLVGLDGGYLKFDFALFANSCLTFLIELDGMQHYKPIDFFGGVSKFETRKVHDNMKTVWALEHDIPLVRIDVSACNADSDFLALYESVFETYHILD